MSAKKYAQALYEVVDEAQDSKELDKSIRNFILLLDRFNNFKKIDDIIRHFSFIYNKENNISDGELIIAQKFDDNVINKIKDCIKDFLQAKDVNLSQKIDEKIIGGFKAVFSDNIIDASIKSRLTNIKNSLIS